MEQIKCKRCGYKWTPITDSLPKACAACKSYRWNQDPIRKKRPEEIKKN